MVASYDRLVYMIKATAPHLQSYSDELRVNIKKALAEKDLPKPPAASEAPKDFFYPRPVTPPGVVPKPFFTAPHGR